MLYGANDHNNDTKRSKGRTEPQTCPSEKQSTARPTIRRLYTSLGAPTIFGAVDTQPCVKQHFKSETAALSLAAALFLLLLRRFFLLPLRCFNGLYRRPRNCASRPCHRCCRRRHSLRHSLRLRRRMKLEWAIHR